MASYPACTSLGGASHHWMVTGVTSIYPREDKDGKPLPLEAGFRIYLHIPPDPDGAPFGEQPHPATGSQSTSEPHPSQDPEAEPWEGPKRDRVDR